MRKNLYVIRGRTVLDDPTITVNTKYLERFDEFQEFRARGRDDRGQADTTVVADTDDSTPDESLQAAHKKLEAALAANLLDHVRSATPLFFEHMIVDLLIAMGYGGTPDYLGIENTGS